jgi:hypothetical protein
MEGEGGGGCLNRIESEKGAMSERCEVMRLSQTCRACLARPAALARLVMAI